MSKQRQVGLLSMCERVAPTNMEKMAKLTALAKGNRTAAAFADACDVDAATISRILNAKLKKNLSDDVVAAIAANSVDQSAIFFQKLLDAHGLVIPAAIGKPAQRQEELYSNFLSQVRSSFDMSREIKMGPIYIKVTRKEAIINRIQDTVLNYLVRAGYRVELSKNVERTQRLLSPATADIIIETNALESEPVAQWAFVVIEDLGLNFLSYLSRFVFGTAYMNKPLQKGLRITLVTTDWKTFYYARKRLQSIVIYDSISILLVHPRINKIEAEYVLERETEPITIFAEGKTDAEIDWTEIFNLFGEEEF